MLDNIRRVVTGHNASNRSVVLFDGRVAAAKDLPTDVALWATDSSPAGNRGDNDAAGPCRSNRPLAGRFFASSNSLRAARSAV